MANYCGKDCEVCTRKQQQECQGCKPGPGSGCEIAACCRDKRHEHCGTCTNGNWCGKRSRRDGMPEYRDRKLAEQAEREAEMARKAPILGRWLWILFWLWIPSTVAGLLGYDAFAELAPGVYLTGQILSTLCSLAYALILLRLSAESQCYRLAGALYLVATAINLVETCLSAGGKAPTWALLIALPGVVLGLMAEYQECMGHIHILRNVDEELSGKWCWIWKWLIGVYVALACSIVVMLVSPVLGLLVVLAALVGFIVVAVLKQVYLYRSAQVFRNGSEA